MQQAHRPSLCGRKGRGGGGESAVLENELDFKTAYQVALGD